MRVTFATAGSWRAQTPRYSLAPTMKTAFVTANVNDFLKLARARDVHPAIILLEDGAASRDEQLRLLRGRRCDRWRW